ncbi:hypothetical protein ARSEF1564_009335 [Beauveria bassiana]
MPVFKQIHARDAGLEVRNEQLRRSGQHTYGPYGARKIRVAAARVIARKLISAPEAVLASGVVGTGGPDNVQDAEGAEEGNIVTEELFLGQRGAPEGADALFVVLELTFEEDMAVVRLADMSDGTREGQLAV